MQNNDKKVSECYELREVLGFGQRYYVSNKGDVFSNRSETSGKYLKPSKNQKGYLSVKLGNPSKEYKIHRLVAVAFIPNPSGLPQINHKNGIKDDNRVENLEWCSASHNTKEAYRIGLLKSWNKGRVNVYSEETKNKMSRAMKGKKLTEEHKRKVGRAVSLTYWSKHERNRI